MRPETVTTTTHDTLSVVIVSPLTEERTGTGVKLETGWGEWGPISRSLYECVKVRHGQKWFKREGDFYTRLKETRFLP